MHAGDNMPGFDLTVRLVTTSLEPLLDAIFSKGLGDMNVPRMYYY